jgi:hypothetical protein
MFSCFIKTPAVLAPLFRGNALHSGIGDLSSYIPREDPCGLAASILDPGFLALPSSGCYAFGFIEKE